MFISVCVCVYVLSHLAETLSREGVTHFLLGSRLVAVTRPAVGVTIETRGAAVTLTADDVVLTSGKNNKLLMLETQSVQVY